MHSYILFSSALKRLYTVQTAHRFRLLLLLYNYKRALEKLLAP